MNIIDALHRKEIFGPLFKDLGTWHPWEVFLRGLFGLELERRTRAGGKNLVTHYPGGHDDLTNAAAGVCVLVHRTMNFPMPRFWRIGGGELGQPACDSGGRLIREWWK